MNTNRTSRAVQSVSIIGVATAVMGGLLLWYGWKRRTSMLGRFTSTAGLSLLAKAIGNPALGGLLGPLQGLLEGPLSAARNLL